MRNAWAALAAASVLYATGVAAEQGLLGKLWSSIADGRHTWQCFLPAETELRPVLKDTSPAYDVNIMYDRNGDGRPDYQEAYDLMGAREMRPFPRHYWIDDDFDGTPDREYRDVNGDGQCKDMVPVEGEKRG